MRIHITVRNTIKKTYFQKYFGSAGNGKKGKSGDKNYIKYMLKKHKFKLVLICINSWTFVIKKAIKNLFDKFSAAQVIRGRN